MCLFLIKYIYNILYTTIKSFIILKINMYLEKDIYYDKLKKLAYKKITWRIVSHSDIASSVKWVSRFTQKYGILVLKAIDFYEDLLCKYRLDNVYHR